MEKQQQIHIVPSDGDREVIIRHGEAAPIHQPKTIKLAGNIYAPGAFVKARKAEIEPFAKKTHVVVNREGLVMQLVVNEQAPDGYVVSGQMLVNPDLKALAINSDNKTYSLSELQKLLKFRKFLFAEPANYGQIMSALHDLKITQNKQIEASKDNRGNARNLVEQTANSNVPLNFSLRMPLYEGGDEYTFLVEIGYEVRDAGTSFWLESLELVDLLRRVADEVFDTQLELMADYAIIEQ